MRNHSWNPPSPLSLLKGRGRTFQNLEGQKFLLERGDKPVKREVDVEMGGRGGYHLFATLQFSSATFTLCVRVCVCVSLYYFSDLQSFELAMQDFHPHSH